MPQEQGRIIILFDRPLMLLNFYPFLLDTSILCGHIGIYGKIYPQAANQVLWPEKKSAG